MATNLDPNILRRLKAGEQVPGYSLYSGGNFNGSPESGGQYVQSSSPDGINYFDPATGLYTSYGMDGGFLNEGNGKNGLTLKDVIGFAAAVYGLGAVSSALSAAGPAASSAGGAAAAGDWGALESLGNLAEPGYYTGGTELGGSLVNTAMPAGEAATSFIPGADSAASGIASTAAGPAAVDLGSLGGVTATGLAAGAAGAAPSVFNAAKDSQLANKQLGLGPSYKGPSSVDLGSLGGVTSTAGGLFSGGLPSVNDLLPYGAPLVGGLLQSNAANRASDNQLTAAREANALQKGIYDSTVARNAPFVAGGLQSFNALLDRLGLSDNKGAAGYGSFGKIPSSADVMAEPGYQFGLSEGQKAINNKLNAQGMSYSGPAIKAAGRFGTDYATTKYDSAFNRGEAAKTNEFNKFSGVAGMGINASNMTAQAGTSYANAAGNNLIGGADAQAANSLAQGNIWSNALNQGVSSYLRGSGGAGNSGKIYVPGLGWVTPDGGG